MPNITQDFVRSILYYNRLTGIFTWNQRPDRDKRWNSRFAGTTAGSISSGKRSGYINIKITVNGQSFRFLAHRLAWFYETGEWPEKELDHKDRDRTNNKWDNIRPATHIQNSVNSNRIIIAIGVRKLPSGRWQARMTDAGKCINLGVFDSEIAALGARVAALNSRSESEFLPQ